jgi:hypothetical protein
MIMQNTINIDPKASEGVGVKKSKFSKFFVPTSWFFGVIAIFGGLGSLGVSPAGGIFYILAGLSVIPYITAKYITPKIGSKIVWIAPIVYFVLFGIGVSSIPKTESTQTASIAQVSSVVVAKTPEEQAKIDAQKVIDEQNKAEAKKQADEKLAIEQKAKADIEAKKQADEEKARLNKPGTVISGISRKEIEDTYNSLKDKSKVKADEYKKSVVGKEFVWVGEVKNVDTDIIGEQYVSVDMSGLSVNIKDKAKEFSNLEKKQIVKITGTVDNVSETFGVTLYVNATNVEVIK